MAFLCRFGTTHGQFTSSFKVTGRFRMPPGDYVIVPSTYDSDEEGDFMLRIFTNGFVESTCVFSSHSTDPMDRDGVPGFWRLESRKYQ